MTVLSARRPTGHPLWISVFLLLIFVQMLTSLVLYGGVFILSNEALISPFRFCLTSEHGGLSCNGSYRSPVNGAESKIIMDFLTSVVIICLYVPLVLVAFALLAMLLAAYGKDRAALWFSVACQAASIPLILTGIIGFFFLYQSYVSWEHMTLWFYVCVGVQVELIIVTVLTHESGRRLTSDWE